MRIHVDAYRSKIESDMQIALACLLFNLNTKIPYEKLKYLTLILTVRAIGYIIRPLGLILVLCFSKTEPYTPKDALKSSRKHPR
jgi:hypothetical protein